MFSMIDVLYFSISWAIGVAIGIRIICYLNKYLDKKGYLLENSKER